MSAPEGMRETWVGAALAWLVVPAYVVRRSACGFYEIRRHVGVHGERFVCVYQEGNPKRTVRMFSLHALMQDALRDAEYHACTGLERS